MDLGTFDSRRLYSRGNQCCSYIQDDSLEELRTFQANSNIMLDHFEADIVSLDHKGKEHTDFGEDRELFKSN